MFDYLDTLRQKPPHVRMQITYVTTSILFFIIITVWWNSWSAAGSAQTTNAIAEKSPINVVASALSGMKEQTLSSWKETIANVQNIASSTDVAAVAASQDNSPTNDQKVNAEQSSNVATSTNENVLIQEESTNKTPPL